MIIRDQAAAIAHAMTPEGFVRLRARIGRAGLHEYSAAELGTPAGFAPQDRVRVYRPPAEVFDPASMASFAGKPVTDDHPPAMVDAGNWRRYAVGHAGEQVVQDGDHLATDLVIADATAADRARAGAALSNGYHADFVFEPGTTPDGEPYDALQRNIRGNHIALVEDGRCGDSCRTAPRPAGDCACPAVPAAATDAAMLDALVRERTAVLDGARRLLGPAFEAGDSPTAAIRRLAVARHLGEARLAGRDDAYLAAAFDTLLAMRTPPNPLAAHLAASGHGGAPTTRDAALAARDQFLTDAWKGAPLHGVL